MYKVYHSTGTFLFVCSEHDLLTHVSSITNPHQVWICTRGKDTLPCLLFETWPKLAMETYHTARGGQWVQTLHHGVYAIFKNEKHLAMFHHVFPTNRASPPKDQKRPLFDVNARLTVSRFFLARTDEADHDDTADIETLLFGDQGKELARHYHTWHRVLYVLVNTFKTHEDEKGKQLWIRFSKQCPSKYRRQECLSLWQSTACFPQGLKIGSLIQMVRETVVLKIP